MKEKYDVIIIDEAQFLDEEQVNQLGDIVIQLKIPVMCFGLKTDFQTKMFPGSKRLFEIAESINEIKTICKCGRKATVNARIDSEGNVTTKGAQVELGGNDRYIAMCYKCFSNIVRKKHILDINEE
jgi:thymidine kinase